ncbi:MAG: IPT/TIG domain-containing protein [Spirochaetales bacterium]|nr:IPT/TIG domain-containing protein [Spirochaetales bacterium]
MSSPFVQFFKKRAYLPFLLFAIVLVLLYFSSKMVEQDPQIFLVEPAIASPGDVVQITGEDFQSERKGGAVTLAGSRITSSSYLDWSDNQIKFRVPSDAGSGMITVTTSRGKSNGRLFTNRIHIPIILSGPAAPGLPYIESIEPSQGAVGTLVTVKGLNFGFDRSASQVLFSVQSSGEDHRRDGGNFIPCSETDYDYESWTDHEIQFYVPDGASSGGVKIVGDKGESNSKYFEVRDLPGTRLYPERKGYQLSYEVSIFSPRGRPDGSLDLWIPGIYPGLEQRAVEWVRDPEPLWNNYFGVMRYHYEGISGQSDQKIELTYWFERYSVETQMEIQRIKTQYNIQRRLYDVYTSPDDFVPGDEGIKSLADRIKGRESNPYKNAEKIYDYLIENLKFTTTPSSLDPVKALGTGQGDSYIYSILFTALARASGIPARPVAGYLVYNDKVTVRHFWSEFYIEDFGWIPLDPALGDEAKFGNFPQGIDNVSDYYFGNIDNRHITFSRGVIPLKSFLPDGDAVVKSRMFSIQTLHEEASGLDYYDTFWKDVRIIDWW